MIAKFESLLRTQLSDNPEVFGPWPVAKPGFVVLIENMGETAATVHVKGGQSRNGPFVRQYGADSEIVVQPYCRSTPVVVTDIPKFLALHLESVNPDGVRVTICSYYPVPDQDTARESLTVV